MINSLNLHCHDIDVYYYNPQGKIFILEKTISPNSNSLQINPKNLYGLFCRNCDKLYSDYNSRCKINNFNVSLFSKEKERWNRVIEIFQFFQFNDISLIGTKEEINKYINEKYKELENEKKILTKKINKLELKNYDLNKNEKNVNIKIEYLEKELASEKKIKTKLKDELDKTQLENTKILQQLENERKTSENLETKILELRKNKEELKIKEESIKKISQDLKKQKEENINLKNYLGTIAGDNNKNMNLILKQLEHEKSLKKNLEEKNIELKKQEKEKSEKYIELEKQIKILTKNNMFGLKFESDCKEGEYDIILVINSFRSLLKGGWAVKYCLENGKKNYLNKKNKPTIILGAIGNGNKGKSFILEKLTSYKIKKGFNVKTEGLSIRYGSNKSHNVTILDSAGQETPLLTMSEENNINNFDGENANEIKKDKDTPPSLDEEKEEEKEKAPKEDKYNKKNENAIDQPSEGEEFEEFSRDKLSIELFLQKFIIYYSNILILVVGNISLTEQKLLGRVKDGVFKGDINNKNKKLFVVHNLKEFTTEEQVNDYIENTLKKLYNTKIEERPHQFLKENNLQDKFFDKYFVETDKFGNANVTHLIFVNEFSEIADYYNFSTINFIQKSIELVQERQKFPIIDECKKFFVGNFEEIIEEDLHIENLKIIEGDKEDRIVLQNLEKITLKKLVTNEIGFTFNNFNDSIKYSYYINKVESMFYVNIELPGGGKIMPKIKLANGFYYFIYEGIKNGDLILEEDKKSGQNKLIKFKPKQERKTIKFKEQIKISTSEMLLIVNGKDLEHCGEPPINTKGVYTFKYQVLILNKSDKNPPPVYEL